MLFCQMCTFFFFKCQTPENDIPYKVTFAQIWPGVQQQQQRSGLELCCSVASDTLHCFLSECQSFCFILALWCRDPLILTHGVGLKYLFMFCMKLNYFTSWINCCDMLNCKHAHFLLRFALSSLGTRSPPFSVHAVKRTWLPVWRKAWACAYTTCLRSRCSTGVRSAAMVMWRREKSATAGSPRWDQGQNTTSLLLLITRELAGSTWMCGGWRKQTFS